MAGGKGAMADAALEDDNCCIAVTVLLGPAISMSLRFLLPRATLSRRLLLLSATRTGTAGRGGGGGTLHRGHSTRNSSTGQEARRGSIMGQAQATDRIHIVLLFCSYDLY